MGVTIPVPMGIRDRTIYQTMVKMARSISRSAIITIEDSGIVPVSDDPSVSNSAQFVLQESFEVVTNVTWEEFNSDNNVWRFTAGFLEGSVGYTPGDPKNPSVYLDVTEKPISLSDKTPYVELSIDMWVRGIDTIAGTTIQWKARKLS